MIKFLIIRFSSIGDIVITTPIIRCLKQQIKNAEIHYVIKNQFVEVLTGNPYIDKIHVFKEDINELINTLKKENFTYIIDLHKNIRSFVIKARLKVLSFSFNKINFKKWLMTSALKINKLPNVHIVDRYFDTVKLFNVKNDEKGLDFFILPENEISLNQLPEIFRNGYIAFVIGAKHATKQLPINKLIELCKLLTFPIILLGGNEDFEDANLIIQSVGSEKIFNACGKYNIQQSASFVDKAELVITHDTGLMHIAAAFRKIIISIWGNTIPEFGMFPYKSGKSSVIFEIKGLKCRPCSKIGYNRCPKRHFKCMNQIDINAIVQTVAKIISNIIRKG